VAADRNGTVTSIAANAANDVWAATTIGVLANPADPGVVALQRPRLYRLTDTRASSAPAGDDVEPRPLVFTEDPPIFVDEPPPPEPPVTPVETVTKPGPKQTRKVTQKAAVYSVKAGKPQRAKGGGFILYVSFRVRRPVTIGLQALRHGKVVSSSGLKRFKGKRGKLSLKLDRKHWPTKLRFVTKTGGTKSVALPQGSTPR
jgi:hypothetical protein